MRFDLGALTDSASTLAMVPLFLAALLVVARPARRCSTAGCSTGARRVVAGLMQATSLPFIVAATAIGRELGLIDAGEAAALVGAGLLSVLIFPAVGLALLQMRSGSVMTSTIAGPS